MKIFISWSGEQSQKIGEHLRTWLPSALQYVKPYFTPADIEKGTRWGSEIAKELDASQIGIFCLTRENLNSSWLLFESGALAKNLDKGHVCLMLFGVSTKDLTGPLQQFQATKFEKTDVKKLIKTINGAAGDSKLTDSVVEQVFEVWWPRLESDIGTQLKNYSPRNAAPIRSDREILEEILQLSRAQQGKLLPKRTMAISADYISLIESYIETHNLLKSNQPNSLIMSHIQTALPYYINLLRAVRSQIGAEEYSAKVLAIRKLTFIVDEDDDIPF